MKKISKNICYLFLSFIVIASTKTVMATNTWSDAKTYSLKATDGWKRGTLEGEWMGNLKTTNSNKYDVYTVSKTMWSNPQFRLVNSNNVAVSSTVTTAGEGRYVTGSGNTGTIGYAYYGSVKPAWNQVGNGRIKLQMKAK